MEHDHRCDQQDADLRQVIDRTQKLVTEKHQHDLDIQAVKISLDTLCRRVPESMPSDLVTLRLQMAEAMKDIEALQRTVANSFASKDDFLLLRTQWYYLIGLICTGFVAGLVSFIVKGGINR